MRELERDLADAARKARARTLMSRALECFEAGVAFVDTAQPGWRALHCSSAFVKARRSLPCLAAPCHVACREPLMDSQQHPARGSV